MSSCFYLSISSKGICAIHKDVLEELRARDERDSKRYVAPMLPAQGAFVLDTSDMSEEVVLEKALTLVNEVKNKYLLIL